MSTIVAKKHPIEIAEDDPARQTARKTLKIIHSTNLDKENITGALQVSKPTSDMGMKKKVTLTSTETQTNASGITEEVLTAESANLEYWQARAEQATERAHRIHVENEELRARVDHYRNLYEMSQELLEESRNMVDVLKEVLRNEVEANADDDDPDYEAHLAHSSDDEREHANLNTN